MGSTDCEEYDNACDSSTENNNRNGFKNGLNKSGWNKCVFGGFLSVAAGMLLGTVGTVLCASELPVVLGTGVGISMAAAYCGKSLSDAKKESDDCGCPGETVKKPKKEKEPKCKKEKEPKCKKEKEPPCKKEKEPPCKKEKEPPCKKEEKEPPCKKEKEKPKKEEECKETKKDDKICRFEKYVKGYKCTCECIPDKTQPKCD